MQVQASPNNIRLRVYPDAAEWLARWVPTLPPAPPRPRERQPGPIPRAKIEVSLRTDLMVPLQGHAPTSSGPGSESGDTPATTVLIVSSVCTSRTTSAPPAR